MTTELCLLFAQVHPRCSRDILGVSICEPLVVRYYGTLCVRSHRDLLLTCLRGEVAGCGERLEFSVFLTDFAIYQYCGLNKINEDNSRP